MELDGGEEAAVEPWWGVEPCLGERVKRLRRGRDGGEWVVDRDSDELRVRGRGEGSISRAALVGHRPWRWFGGCGGCFPGGCVKCTSEWFVAEVQ